MGNTWDERMTPRPRREPRFEHLTTFFRVRGATRRPLRAALYSVDTGHELRLEYEDNGDLQRSQLFTVYDADAIAELADQWHRVLEEKGFEELVIDE